MLTTALDVNQPLRPKTAQASRVADSFAALAGLIASEFSYQKDEEIFGEDEPAEYVYQVVSGSVRTYKLLSDGRRQIGSFHLPGDVFGLESGATHRLAAEAIGDDLQLGDQPGRRDQSSAANLLRRLGLSASRGMDVGGCGAPTRC